MKYDIFISYASEDKFDAEKLYEALSSFGLKVWFDQNEVRVGNYLREEIEKGLSNSL